MLRVLLIWQENGRERSSRHLSVERFLQPQFKPINFWDSTFPDNQSTNAGLFKCAPVSIIPLYIFLELFKPEFNTGFWSISKSTALMAMPEAPMNENDSVVFRQHNIRSAGDVLRMSPKGHTQLPQYATDN